MIVSIVYTEDIGVGLCIASRDKTVEPIFTWFESYDVNSRLLHF